VLHDYPRGLAEYAAGLRVAPNDPELLSFAGANEAILGHWDSADVHLLQAQVLDPRSATTAVIRAHMLLAERRYAEAQEVSDRALALAPDNIVAMAQGVAARVARGDLADGQAAIRAGLTRMDENALVTGLLSYGLTWTLPEAQQQALLRLTPAQFDNDRATWAGILAQTYWERGNRAKAEAYADSARIVLEHQVQETPENANAHAALGLMLAYLARKSEAIREGERAISLIPVAKDALNGPYYVLGLAEIHLVLGQPEQTLDLVESVLRMHCVISPVWLKMDPTFTPLRGNPRFERLVNGS